jgi:site-specific recombinase XerC
MRGPLLVHLGDSGASASSRPDEISSLVDVRRRQRRHAGRHVCAASSGRRTASPDVDAAQGTIRVLHGKYDLDRVVGIDDGALAVIQLWTEARKRLVLKNGLVFVTLAGTKLRDNQVRQMIKRRAAKAGIEKNVHPHMLRHTHAAELAAGACP